ncbi:MAG: hypothetical protein COY58_07640, partial [Gammaproteobacteria bacterium CG_4_10_14_0_8_um_filter_38_16]
MIFYKLQESIIPLDKANLPEDQNSFVIFDTEEKAHFLMIKKEGCIVSYRVQLLLNAQALLRVEDGSPRPENEQSMLAKKCFFSEEEKEVAFFQAITQKKIEAWCCSAQPPQEFKDFGSLIDANVTLLITEKLNALQKRPLTIQALGDFLKNHWIETRCTAIGYTALPNNPAILFLCQLATSLAGITKKTPIELLMPGIETEFQYDDFQSLAEQPLEGILSTHILSESGRYLFPVAVLAVSVQEESNKSPYPRRQITDALDEIVNPCCDISEDPESMYLTLTEQERLFEHNQNARGYREAWRKYNRIARDKSTLFGRLQELIEGLKRNDAHGGLGTQEEGGSGTYSVIQAFQEYYDRLSPEEKQKVPPEVEEQISLLINLASQKAVPYQVRFSMEKPGQLDAGQLDEGTIYVWKDTKVAFCAVRDFRKKNNVLVETLSQETVYTADTVLEMLVKKGFIPESKAFFISQAHLMETCIGTRGETLSRLVQNDDVRNTLFTIALSEGAKANELKVVQAVYKEHVARLAKAKGQDHWSMTTALLSQFRIQPAAYIRGDQQIVEVMQLSEQDIRSLLGSDEAKTAFVQVVGLAVDNWVIWIHNNHAEKVHCVLTLLSNKLSMIKNFKDLAALLFSLDDLKKLSSVIGAMQDRLPELIPTPWELSRVLSSLAPDQCKAVCEAMKDRLPELIPTLRELSSVLRSPPDRCKAVCEAMQDHLPKLIPTLRELSSV